MCNYEVLERPNVKALEQIWVKFSLNKLEYIVGSLYRPPAARVSDFLEVFEDVIADFAPVCKEIICGGDININLLDVEDSNSIKFGKAVDCFNLKQIIDRPTRKLALLDIILIAHDCDNFAHGVKTVYGRSDHS